jgi:hypothetical protein
MSGKAPDGFVNKEPAAPLLAAGSNVRTPCMDSIILLIGKGDSEVGALSAAGVTSEAGFPGAVSDFTEPPKLKLSVLPTGGAALGAGATTTKSPKSSSSNRSPMVWSDVPVIWKRAAKTTSVLVSNFQHQGTVCS